VAVVEAGTVVETGAFADLYADAGSRFRDLINKQRGDGDGDGSKARPLA
jgi:ABC-type multidrug transport system fused ATPase/permease subunit